MWLVQKHYVSKILTFKCIFASRWPCFVKETCKQVKNCDKKLKEMLMQYNSYRDSLSVENRQQFKELQTSDLRIEVEGLLIDVEDETDVAATIPYSVRRQAIDMRHLWAGARRKLNLSRKK